MAKTQEMFTGVGRRKTAVAQTRLTTGTGVLLINGKERALPRKIAAMYELVGRTSQLNAEVILRGGGKSGQIDAAAMGIARALVALNPDFRSTLRKGGYLTRDARIVERKKPGLKKARRAPQWAKR
jgi:small subunit ribosomal protein S9